MSSKFLTYLFSCDYEEWIDFSPINGTVETVTRELSDLLRPDTTEVVLDNQDHIVYLMEHIGPQMSSGTADFYFVRRIETILAEWNLTLLRVHYYIDTPVKILSNTLNLFFAITLFIWCNRITFDFNSWQTDVELIFTLVVIFISKLFIYSYIHIDISKHHEKLSIFPKPSK